MGGQRVQWDTAAYVERVRAACFVCETLVVPGWLGRGNRGAHCCVSCEAVVVDPKVPTD